MGKLLLLGEAGRGGEQGGGSGESPFGEQVHFNVRGCALQDVPGCCWGSQLCVSVLPLGPRHVFRSHQPPSPFPLLLFVLLLSFVRPSKTEIQIKSALKLFLFPQ